MQVPSKFPLSSFALFVSMNLIMAASPFFLFLIRKPLVQSEGGSEGLVTLKSLNVSAQALKLLADQLPC